MSEQPKSARSKSQSKNPLKHGVYSREPMLERENLRDYEALRAEVCEEYVPEGVTERHLVDRLVTLLWRKQRNDRYEHLSLQRRVDDIEQENAKSRNLQNLKDVAPEFSVAVSVEAVEAIFSNLHPTYREVITLRLPLKNIQDPAQWGPAIGKFLSSLNPKDQLDGSAKFLAIMDPVVTENELARSARLDQEIDRTIKRMLQVKTAKQVFPNMRPKVNSEPKLIKVPAQAKRQTEQNSILPAKVVISAKPELN